MSANLVWDYSIPPPNDKTALSFSLIDSLNIKLAHVDKISLGHFPV